MALFWAYIPEPDELEVLLAAGGPAPGEELERREDRLTVGYLELQAYCNRNRERYLTRTEVLEIVREGWVLDALCAALPNRPPLLHRPGAPGTQCPFEGCLDRCLDEGCDCSIGAWQEGADFRLCLTR